jgi:CDGSH-type Zn-finger protein
MPDQTTSPDSFPGELAPGTYYWCACGRSREQPFCDGSHVASTCLPVKFRIARPQHVLLCGCKHSRTPPYCDQSCVQDPRAPM